MTVTLNSIIDLLDKQKESRWLTYTCTVDKRTGLLTINLMTINKEWQTKRKQINNDLYTKVAKVLKAFGKYEAYMVKKWEKENQNTP